MSDAEELPKDAMKLVGDGEALLRMWRVTQQRLGIAQMEAKRAADDAKKAEDDFARWLLPAKANAYETAAVWFGDTLIQAELTREGGKVSIRHQGRSLNR